MLEQEAVAATLDRYYAAVSGGDRDGYLSLWAEDGEVFDPPGAKDPTAKGHEALGSLFDGAMSGTFSYEYEWHGKWICGSEAAVHATCAITGDTFTLEIPILYLFEFADDGRISRLKAFWTRESRAVTGTLPESWPR